MKPSKVETSDYQGEMDYLPPLIEQPIVETATYRNKGSFGLSDECRSAHRIIVDLEILSVTRPQYYNFLYSPRQGDYCNVTMFHGSHVRETIKVKYPKVRLLDWVNVEASTALMLAGGFLTVRAQVAALATALGFSVVGIPGHFPSTWGCPLTIVKVVCPEDTQFRITVTWYPFAPLFESLTPEPDLHEPTIDNDEYPNPDVNPPDEPWADNEPTDAWQEGRDPRDYGDDNPPLGSPPDEPPPEPIPECEINLWKVEFNHSSFNGVGEYALRGPVSYSRGPDGRQVILTGGHPGVACPPVQMINITAFSGVDAEGTVTLTKL